MKRNGKTPSLLACILMDVLGYATYSLPLIGELADLAWAPISALIFFRMFGGWKGAFGGLFSFAEELLPGMDFIPTFTIAWVWKYFTSGNAVEKQAQPTTLFVNGRTSHQPVTNR
jgi:hypothetical protein